MTDALLRRTVLGILLVACVFPGCATRWTPAPAAGATATVSVAQRAKVVALIEARARQFERNFLTGNIERLVDDYFVPDALEPTLSGPGGVPPFRGRAALAAQFGQIRKSSQSIAIRTEEIFVGQDLAQEFGRVAITGVDGTVRKGRYTVLWVRTGEAWLAKLDFFSPDAWAD